MKSLHQIISEAQALIDANPALLAAYDPASQPLRAHLDVAAETAIRKREARALSGLERLEEALMQTTADIADPSINDSVKADILAKIMALVGVHDVLPNQD